MKTLLTLLNNSRMPELGQSEYYVAIIGESPSDGAKSPVLWNNAFQKLNISAMMHPMDVSYEQLSQLLQVLRDDDNFIGGAVTVPYKQVIIPFLDSLEKEAETIGAVNCVYRDGKKLIGANTDGAGALLSLKEKMGEQTMAGKTIVVIGLGGAGRAVATYLAGEIGNNGKLILANRTPDKCKDIADKLENLCNVEIIGQNQLKSLSDEVAVLVNCSSIGFEIPRSDNDKSGFFLRPYTPLAPVGNIICIRKEQFSESVYIKENLSSIQENLNQSLEILNEMKPGFIFDIIYQPKETLLLQLSALFGIPVLNGAEMNLEQAVIAFSKAVDSLSMQVEEDKIRMFMKDVW